jgi:hypothetical protein
MISTRDLSPLPDVEPLRRLMQSLAMLDAVLSPEWQFRYFSFDSRWAPGEQMGSMHNGSGDEYFALFNRAGCWLKGFAHEAPLSPYATVPPRVAPGVLDGVPPEFAGCLNEPAFAIDATTFCIWRRHGDPHWQHGPITLPDGNDPDGSADLLRWLDGRPETYRDWVHEYYERKVPLAAVRAIYRHKPLDQELVTALNNLLVLADLEEDISQIGYPSR